MLQVNTMPSSPRAPSFHHILIQAVFTTLISLLTGWFRCETALAEAPGPATPRTTLIVFADHRMPDAEWVDLIQALRRGQPEVVAAMPALAGQRVEIFRGDRVDPGLRVESVITVFLHGDCTLLPRQRVVVQGALGWVPRSKGVIAPFVNVNCTPLVSMLGPYALGMSSDRRNAVMAEAMARVIVHEWIHVATQSARHGHHGVRQSVFGVRDLLADDRDVRLPWYHGSL